MRASSFLLALVGRLLSFHMTMWLSFYSGLSTPLIGLYALPCACLTGFKYCPFGSLEARKCESSNFVFIFKILWGGGEVFLQSHMNLEMGIFCIEIMIVIALHTWTALCDVAVTATVSSLPGHELRISLQIFVIFSHSCIGVL